MTGDVLFEEINEAKANLEHIYNEPDPRPYFRELGKLDYAIPENAKPIFETLIRQLEARRRKPIRVLDIGCSYGVNAALLKHDLSMDTLYDHWGKPGGADLTSRELAAQDRSFFNSLAEQQDIKVIGLDLAEKAVGYAEQVGLLDASLTVNLEDQPLPGNVHDEFAEIDLMMSTGCVGYVTEKSFDKLLLVTTQGEAPWIANFVLRLFPFDPIAKALEGWGYVTEKLEGQSFVQREFASEEEREGVLEQIRARGLDPTGMEADGYLHAEFYLSRPAVDAAETPLTQLLQSS